MTHADESVGSEHHIAGWKTPGDWRRLRDQLSGGQDPALWNIAYQDYFIERLQSRYLTPIAILQEHGTFSGEGFSIAAIQCSLIEFLESTVQGVSYRYLRKGETLQKFEYSSSSKLFQEFLTGRDPFKEDFDAEVAGEFYVGVRCGLLHEARTKNGWLIRAKDPTGRGRCIDPAQRIMFRDDFHSALLSFVTAYGAMLIESQDLQDAFIRKFDSLSR